MPAMAMAPSAQPQPQPSPRAQPQPQERVASPLDEAARAEHAQAIELFGLYTVQCLRSSHAELRQDLRVTVHLRFRSQVHDDLP